jgi:hypothetical protein
LAAARFVSTGHPAEIESALRVSDEMVKSDSELVEEEKTSVLQSARACRKNYCLLCFSASMAAPTPGTGAIGMPSNR